MKFFATISDSISKMKVVGKEMKRVQVALCPTSVLSDCWPKGDSNAEVNSANLCFRLWTITRILGMWGPLTKLLKMSERDWWVLLHVVTS